MIFAVTKLYYVDTYCVTSKSSLVDTNINISKKLIMYWTNSIYKLDYHCKNRRKNGFMQQVRIYSHQCLSTQSNDLGEYRGMLLYAAVPTFSCTSGPHVLMHTSFSGVQVSNMANCFKNTDEVIK